MFWNRQRGLVGVDIGAGAVKIAQVIRRRSGLELAGASIVRRETPWTSTLLQEPQSATSADEIAGGLSLANRVAGRRAASVISLAPCQLHRLPLDPADRTPNRLMRELAQVANFREKQVFDWWSATHPEDRIRGDGPPCNVVSMPQTLANRVAQDLFQAHLECDRLDCAATAVAQAMRWMPGNPKRILGVVDCGFSQATYLSIYQERPVYVRRLKDTGFVDILGEMSSSLGCSPEEAMRLLADYGCHAPSPSSAAGRLTAEVLLPLVERLAAELRRTLEYLAARRRSALPTALVLLGAGGTIGGLDRWLQQQLDLPVRLWRPDPKALQVPNSLPIPLVLLAPAIAASAQAWEKQ